VAVAQARRQLMRAQDTLHVHAAHPRDHGPVSIPVLCCAASLQDFLRLLQDVNRTTKQAIQVYVDEVRLSGVCVCGWVGGAAVQRRHMPRQRRSSGRVPAASRTRGSMT
jgi:hypothetical protein